MIGAAQAAWLLMGAGLLVLAGGAMLGGGAWQERRRHRVGERLTVLVGAAPPEAGPRGLVRLLHRLLGDQGRRHLATRLHAAGFHHPEAPALFHALRLACTLALTAGAGLALMVASHGRPWQTATAVGAAAVAGYLLPRVLLDARGVARQARVRREMGFLADLMALVLESGVSLDQCLRYVGLASARTAPSVQHSFRMLMDELDKGVAYDTAMERWGDRLGIPEGREFAFIFRQSLLYGAEMGPLLHNFSQEWADRRVMSAREAAGRAATKLTVILVGFMLPPLLVLLTAPALSSVLHTIGSMRR